MVQTEKIKFTVYRNKLEPVTKQNRAEVILHHDLLEVIIDYEFDAYLPSPERLPYRRYATLVPKHRVEVELTEACHRDDTDNHMSPVVYISTSFNDAQIEVKTFDEAYTIYNKIKEWLLK